MPGVSQLQTCGLCRVMSIMVWTPLLLVLLSYRQVNNKFTSGVSPKPISFPLYQTSKQLQLHLHPCTIIHEILFQASLSQSVLTKPPSSVHAWKNLNIEK